MPDLVWILIILAAPIFLAFKFIFYVVGRAYHRRRARYFRDKVD